MSQPLNDSQFAAYDLDPLLARVLNAVYGIAFHHRRVQTCCRLWSTLLRSLRRHARGPIADMLRLNTGVPPTRWGAESG